MFNFAMTFLLVFGLFLGSGGATVAAAQTSLPDDGLYPVKAWSEDARLQLADNDEVRMRLALEFTARRMEEIRVMLQAGHVPPEAVMTRTQNQLEYTLRLVANMPEDKATPALLQLQNQLELHLQVMMQLRLKESADPALLQIQNRVRTMLMEQIHNAQAGAEDPLQLREQIRTREQQQLPEGNQNQNQNQEQYQNQEQNQDCLLLDCLMNQFQFQYQNKFQNGAGSDELDILETTSDGNPWTEGTPTPYSSYGPGESQNPWTDETPTPYSGYGPGESQNPWTEETPTPGSGYGPGPGPEATCTPQSHDWSGTKP